MNFVFLAPLLGVSMFSIGYMTGRKNQKGPPSDDTFYLLDYDIDSIIEPQNKQTPDMRQQLLSDIVLRQYHLKKPPENRKNGISHRDPFYELHLKLKQIYHATHDYEDSSDV